MNTKYTVYRTPDHKIHFLINDWTRPSGALVLRHGLLTAQEFDHAMHSGLGVFYEDQSHSYVVLCKKRTNIERIAYIYPHQIERSLIHA